MVAVTLPGQMELSLGEEQPAKKSDLVKAFENEDANTTLTQKLVQQVAESDIPLYQVSLKESSSKWKVSSALQKCIRRGHDKLAVKYVQALINGGESAYFWRRFPVILLEDVGLGNVELVRQGLLASRFSTWRAKVGELKLASWLVKAAASGVKSRSWIDLVCLAHRAPAEVQAQAKALTHGPAAAKYDLLWKRPASPMDLVLHHAVMQDVLKTAEGKEFLLSTDMPKALKSIVLSGSKMSVYDMEASVFPVWAAMGRVQIIKTVSTELPDPYMVGGVPDWSYDKHTLDGKRAYAYFMVTVKEQLGPLLGERSNGFDVVALALFQIESALLDRNVSSTVLEKLQETNDLYEGTHLSVAAEVWGDLKQTLKQDQMQKMLRSARIRVVEGKQAQQAYLKQ